VEFYLDKLLSFYCDADPLLKNSKATKNVITKRRFGIVWQEGYRIRPFSCYTWLRGKFFIEKP